MPNIIEVDQLIKRYPGNDQPAVRGLSFAVRRGEIFGLLGPTGAGKTTTLLLLAGQLKPESGTITIAGSDLSHRSSDLKRLSGLVPHKFTLLPGLSLQNNLLWYGWRHGLRDRQLKSRVAEVLSWTGLDCCRGVNQKSSDAAWRISLAATLLHQPTILLIDELTLTNPAESRDFIGEIVTGINQHGVTIVYATRAGEAAARLCHRVALIDEGRIIALDTPDALQALRSDSATRKNLDTVFLELTGKPLHE